jgi:hypothetical protein
MTAEEIITAVLDGDIPNFPPNWRKWIGEDAPQRIAEALRKAGLLKTDETKEQT